MRVITGTARGRKLVAPQGLDTRPTSDMAKEALFSIIQFEVEGSAVLDLFAGSGQLGIEALSRGARSAVFVDASREANQAITQNLEHTKLKDHARIVMMDAVAFLKTVREPFDIALLDPPYNKELINSLLPLLVPCMNPGGIIMCETERDEMLPEAVGIFAARKEYRYGKAKLTTYRAL
ncbi:16S rRNA (guanine(966)-N(2))-methyltransferase RsmD [Oscillospiraceae bacterium LTW-04]|nr:16S rRNA (guanine(966)-N(2))-methyltransferase RsmD [Oscillospiraceae bacterium MB24-C1]